MPGTHTRTTTERGLGYRHKKRVEYLIANLIDGTLCWWCGKPMYRWQRLSGDHSTPRAIAGPHGLADRLLHLQCNTDRGDGSRDHLRPALGGDTPRNTDRRQASELGTRVLRWPS